jgi:hypothetical protein
MVTTKISEVAGKGLGWRRATTTSGSGSEATPAQQQQAPDVDLDLDPTPMLVPIPSPDRPNAKTTSPDDSSSSSYLDYANESLAQAAEQTYSTISSYLPTFATTPYEHEHGHREHGHREHGHGQSNPTVVEILPLPPQLPPTTPPKTTNLNRQKSFTSPLALFQNPYISVRGGRHYYQPHKPSSMKAVRSLLNVVPVDPVDNTTGTDDNASQDAASSEQGDNNSIVSDNYPSFNKDGSSRTTTPSSSSETASQLAEGTIRAFRDLCLDEAVELHKALRYWSYRWERPFLSWLEAGPTSTYVILWYSILCYVILAIPIAKANHYCPNKTGGLLLLLVLWLVMLLLLSLFLTHSPCPTLPCPVRPCFSLVFRDRVSPSDCRSKGFTDPSCSGETVYNNR